MARIIGDLEVAFNTSLSPKKDQEEGWGFESLLAKVNAEKDDTKRVGCQWMLSSGCSHSHEQLCNLLRTRPATVRWRNTAEVAGGRGIEVMFLGPLGDLRALLLDMGVILDTHECSHD